MNYEISGQFSKNDALLNVGGDITINGHQYTLVAAIEHIGR